MPIKKNRRELSTLAKTAQIDICRTARISPNRAASPVAQPGTQSRAVPCVFWPLQLRDELVLKNFEDIFVAKKARYSNQQVTKQS